MKMVAWHHLVWSVIPFLPALTFAPVLSYPPAVVSGRTPADRVPRVGSAGATGQRMATGGVVGAHCGRADPLAQVGAGGFRLGEVLARRQVCVEAAAKLNWGLLYYNAFLVLHLRAVLSWPALQTPRTSPG